MYYCYYLLRYFNMFLVKSASLSKRNVKKILNRTFFFRKCIKLFKDNIKIERDKRAVKFTFINKT